MTDKCIQKSFLIFVDENVANHIASDFFNFVRSRGCTICRQPEETRVTELYDLVETHLIKEHDLRSVFKAHQQCRKD